MASSLFPRAFVGLKSIRSLPCLLKESSHFTLFLKRTSFTSVAYPSLVFSNFCIYCSSTGSPTVKVSKSFHSMAHDESIVSSDWLQSNLRKPDVKVFDASWYMRDEKPNPFQEFQVRPTSETIWYFARFAWACHALYDTSSTSMPLATA